LATPIFATLTFVPSPRENSAMAMAVPWSAGTSFTFTHTEIFSFSPGATWIGAPCA
jgi:hypothetical protein